MYRLLVVVVIFSLSFSVLAQGTLSVEEAEAIPQEEAEAIPQEEVRFDFTVRDLNYDCKKCAPDPKGHECIYCNGVLTGASTVLGMLEYDKTFCPPETMDTRMVRNFFRRWVIRKSKKDPEIINMRAVKGLVMAMQETFPCQQDQER